MKETDILKRIIQEDGSCTWSKPSICKDCPMSKWKQKANGDYYTCIEALGTQEMTEEDADARYKEVAERLLLDETLDSILGEDDAK